MQYTGLTLTSDNRLVVSVDRYELPAFRYSVESYDMLTKLYFAHDAATGLASYFAHTLGNEGGYGGATFTLPVGDGSIVTIRGPWSSRSSVMNMYFVPATIECTIEDGNIRAGAISVPKLIELINVLNAPIRILKFKSKDDELCYQPVPADTLVREQWRLFFDTNPAVSRRGLASSRDAESNPAVYLHHPLARRVTLLDGKNVSKRGWMLNPRLPDRAPKSLAAYARKNNLRLTIESNYPHAREVEEVPLCSSSSSAPSTKPS